MLDLNAPVLVVDEHSTMRKIIVSALTKIGYSNVTESASADEASTLLKDQRFSLLFAEWHMPSVSGLDLLRRVKRDKKLEGLPVILISAPQTPDKLETALKEGAKGVLVKPVTASVLQQKLPEILSAERS